MKMERIRQRLTGGFRPFSMSTMNCPQPWILLAAGLTLAGCLSGPGNGEDSYLPRYGQTAEAPRKKVKSPKPPSPDQADVGLVEAITGKFVTDLAALQKAKPAVVYLSLTTNRLDPAPQFLKRLRVSGVQIKPFSSAPLARPGSSGLSRNEVLFGIESTEWFDLFDVRATCSWSGGDAVLRQFSYSARWEKNEWLVK